MIHHSTPSILSYLINSLVVVVCCLSATVASTDDVPVPTPLHSAFASPVISNVTGCWLDPIGGPIRCRPGDRLTVMGSGFSVPINVSLNDHYVCTNATLLSHTSVWCILTDTTWEDRLEPLSLRITCGGVPSSPFLSALINYGHLNITSASGCNSIKGRAANCTANETVIFYGTGLGPGTLQATVANNPCLSTKLLSNISLACVLPATTVPDAWMDVLVQSLSSFALASELVSWAPSGPPLIISLWGCLSTANGSISGCHSGELIFMSGQQFTSTNLNVTVGPYVCEKPKMPSQLAISCLVPSILPRDYNRPLPVTVHCDSRTSEPFMGLASNGPFSLGSIHGCATSMGSGSVGCKMGDLLHITGTGFGFPDHPTYITVYIGLLFCFNSTVVNNTLLTCALPAPVIANVPLNVTLRTGGVVVTGVGLVQFAPVPIIASITAIGCYPNMSIVCHGGEQLTLTGPVGSFFLPIVNVSIGGKYACEKPLLVSSTEVQCIMPVIRWQDYGVIMSVRISCGNLTSAPSGGVSSYGPLSVTSAVGCPTDEKNGTVPWRTSGCHAGDWVNVTGTGFDPWLILSVGPNATEGRCYPPNLLNNVTAQCQLPPHLEVNVWLDVRVLSGGREMVGSGLVKMAPPNVTQLAVTIDQ